MGSGALRIVISLMANADITPRLSVTADIIKTLTVLPTALLIKYQELSNTLASAKKDFSEDQMALTINTV